MTEQQELIEAATYASLAVHSCSDPLDSLRNFNVDLDIASELGDLAGDKAAFSMGMLVGMILERRRNMMGAE